MNTTGRRAAEPDGSGRRILRPRAPWRRPVLPPPATGPRRVAGPAEQSRWTPRRALQTGGERATATPPRARGSWRWLWVLVGLAALLVLAIVAGIALVVSRAGASTAAPTTGLADGLLVAADGTAAGGDWHTVAAAGTAAPGCQSTLTDPSATASVTGHLTDGSTSALQVIDEYAQSADAHAAFVARWAQLGSCPTEPTWLLQRSSSVSGLGDEAAWASYTDQAATPQTHVLLLVRTGRVLNRFDVTQPQVPDDASRLATGPVARECRPYGGACATSPAATPSAPPPGDPRGLLNVVDLPLITPGVGHWVRSSASTGGFHGSMCEGDLTAAGATAQSQRSLIVVDDPAAPASFGLDNVAWTFASTDAAQRFADDLLGRLTSCPQRLSTAKVDQPTSFRDVTGGVTVTGQRVTVTQSSANGSVTYHAGVLRTGSSVAYVLETPGSGYGLSDAQWSALATRAALRAAELS